MHIIFLLPYHQSQSRGQRKSSIFCQRLPSKSTGFKTPLFERFLGPSLVPSDICSVLPSARKTYWKIRGTFIRAKADLRSSCDVGKKRICHSYEAFRWLRSSVVGKMWGESWRSGRGIQQNTKGRLVKNCHSRIRLWSTPTMIYQDDHQCFRSNVASLVEYQHIIPVFREHLEIQMPTSQLRSRDQKKFRQALLRDQPRGGMMQFFVGGGPFQKLPPILGENCCLSVLELPNSTTPGKSQHQLQLVPAR